MLSAQEAAAAVPDADVSLTVSVQLPQSTVSRLPSEQVYALEIDLVLLPLSAFTCVCASSDF